MVRLNTKFRLPDDPDQKRAIWQEQLDRIQKAQIEIQLEHFDIMHNVVSLELRMIKTPGLEGERSKLHKLELENRMKELCLREQSKKLNEAIESVS